MTQIAPHQARTRSRGANAAFVHHSQWLGVLAGIIAVAVMFGWHTHNTFLIQLRPDLVALPYNSALLMLLGSLTLIAVVRGHIVSGRLLAGLALLISAVTMTQYFTGIDAGIDQLLMQHYITTQTQFPGRMAISSAFAYLMLNTGFLLFTLNQSGRHVRSVATICAAIVVASVIATVIGYEAELQPLFGWSATTYMALHSALGIFMLGLGLLACSLGEDDGGLAENHSLTTATGFIVIVTSTLLLWSGMTRQRDEQMQAVLDADLRWLGIGINTLYEERANTIERMSRRWEASGGTARYIWEADAESYVATLAGIQAVYYVDESGLVQLAVSASTGSLASGANIYLLPETAAALQQARATAKTTFGSPFYDADGAPHFFLVRPLLVDGSADGFIVAEFRIDELFDMVHAQDPTIQFQVRYAGTIVYATPQSADRAVEASMESVILLGIAGSGWSVQVFPQAQSDLRSRLPDIVLVIGILLALFLAAVLHMWGMSRRSLVAASRANAELERSKRQLNQFRTTLDRTLDCVFMFDAKTYHYIYGNAGALRITGCTLPELMSKHPWELHPSGNEAGFHKLIAPLLSREKDSLTYETLLRGGEGSPIPIECFMQYIAPEGEPARFVTIVRDITQRKRIEQMKSEFVSTVSHELRTPLTSITGALGLIEGGALGEVPAPAMEMVTIAHQNSRRLTHLINDLLDIEKIAAGKVTFDLRTQPVMPLVEQAVEGTRTYGTEHRITLALVQSAPGIEVRVDSQRLLQILSNLLSNAIKFSPEGGTVEIAVEHRAPNVRISVRDYGRGITDEFRGRIFQKFAQADASDIRKQGGTGLGLAISRELAERMNGHLDYDSVSGEGACFYLELPVSNEELQVGGPGAAGTAHRILIVEDDADTALLLRKMLTQAGYASDTAGNGAAALEAVGQHSYAGVILDLKLPDMNGTDIIRELRSRPATADLPIIVVSAQIEDGQLRVKGNISDIHWLPKPVDKLRLMRQIDDLVALSGNGPCRVLHIEDDTDLHQVIRGMAGPHVVFTRAATLKEARHLLAPAAFDVIMLDLGLPDGSGWDLLPEIKTLLPEARLIVLTGQEVSHLDPGRVDSILHKSRLTPRQLLDAIHDDSSP